MNRSQLAASRKFCHLNEWTRFQQSFVLLAYYGVVPWPPVRVPTAAVQCTAMPHVRQWLSIKQAWNTIVIRVTCTCNTSVAIIPSSTVVTREVKVKPISCIMLCCSKWKVRWNSKSQKSKFKMRNNKNGRRWSSFGCTTFGLLRGILFANLPMTKKRKIKAQLWRYWTDFFYLTCLFLYRQIQWYKLPNNIMKEESRTHPHREREFLLGTCTIRLFLVAA